MTQTVAQVFLLVEAASQMAVTAVLFVRTGGQRRNATATTSLFENSYLAHHPRLVGFLFDPEGCFVSREWSETLTRVDTSSIWRRGEDHSNCETIC